MSNSTSGLSALPNEANSVGSDVHHQGDSTRQEPSFELYSLPYSETEAMFLKTILATPEDDTSRLIYADWLEENHQPYHAEYLRIRKYSNQFEEAVVRRMAEIGPHIDRRWLNLVDHHETARWTLALNGWRNKRGHARRKARRFLTHAANLSGAKANALIHSDSGIIRTDLCYADACRLWLGISLWADANVNRQ